MKGEMMAEIQQKYFIARIDISQDSGQQRVFGVYDDEPTAVSAGAMTAATQPGDFAMFVGTPVVKFTKSAAPVQAQQLDTPAQP